METRIDIKGRPYYFIRGERGENFMSATVFPPADPTNDVWAIYIWWQTHTFSEGGGGAHDEPRIIRRAWVSRYLFNAKTKIVYSRVNEKVFRRIDQTMMEVLHDTGAWNSLMPQSFDFGEEPF